MPTHRPILRPTTLAATLAALIAVAATPGADAQAQDPTFDALRREPATLFDLGIIYLRQRIDREVLRYLIKSDINSANGVVHPDAKTGKVLIEVTLRGPTAPCKEVRGYLLEKFLNLEEVKDQAKAAALVMDNAFTHRGVDNPTEPTKIGYDMARRTTFSVRTLTESCSGPLAG